MKRIPSEKKHIKHPSIGPRTCPYRVQRYAAAVFVNCDCPAVPLRGKTALQQRFDRKKLLSVFFAAAYVIILSSSFKIKIFLLQTYWVWLTPFFKQMLFWLLDTRYRVSMALTIGNTSYFPGIILNTGKMPGIFAFLVSVAASLTFWQLRLTFLICQILVSNDNWMRMKKNNRTFIKYICWSL